MKGLQMANILITSVSSRLEEALVEAYLQARQSMVLKSGVPTLFKLFFKYVAKCLCKRVCYTYTLLS